MSEEMPQAEPTWPSNQTSITPTGEPGTAITPAVVQVVPTSGYAIAALILSICSWVVCPIVPAIVGLVMASMADREIREGRAGGGGMSTAAKIIGWINIGVFAALLLLAVVIGIIFAVSGASGSTG